MYDSECLSGVCHTDYHDDEIYRSWRFHRNFWNQRYLLHQEAYLTPDGKIDFDRHGLWVTDPILVSVLSGTHWESCQACA